MVRRAPLLACLFALACRSDDAPTARDDAGALPSIKTDSGATLGDAGQPAAAHSDAATPGSDAGSNTSALSGTHYFPDGAWMYQRIDQTAVDKDSTTITKWLEAHGGFGTGQIRIDSTIEVLTADSSTPKRSFEPTDEFYEIDCDPAPFPLPAGGVLEGETGYACAGDGDCHLIVVNRAEKRLYEMWRANIEGSTFHGGCAAICDMSRVYGPEGRGEQCSSSDAAGFPIAPLLFTADELAAGRIDHAIRFILPNDRMRAKTYQHPGNHAGGPTGGTDAPIYGSRWRLKANFDLSKLPSDGARVVARALQQYGMALADGGSIALTAQSDRLSQHKWEGLLDSYDLKSIKPSDFEIVETGEPIALTYDCTRTPITQ